MFVRHGAGNLGPIKSELRAFDIGKTHWFDLPSGSFKLLGTKVGDAITVDMTTTWLGRRLERTRVGECKEGLRIWQQAG